jgi:hypothetical protein
MDEHSYRSSLHTSFGEHPGNAMLGWIALFALLSLPLVKGKIGVSTA